ncbi:MAG: hypothetical protein AB7Q97_07265 [Gammaproteobacteria bacterium]
MAQIKQVQIAFVPLEDRLLLRLNTDAAEEFRLWITRRYARLLGPVFQRLLETDPIVAQQASAQARDAVLSFRHQDAIERADFSRAFDAAAAVLPLGPAPVLLARVQLKPGPGGGSILCLHPEQGPGVELAMNPQLVHSLSRLFADALDKAQWDLAAPAVRGEPAAAGQRTLN